MLPYYGLGSRAASSSRPPPTQTNRKRDVVRAWSSAMLGHHGVLKGHMRVDHGLLQERLQLQLLEGQEREAFQLAYAAASRLSGSANANQASRERDAAQRRCAGRRCPCGGGCDDANCAGRGPGR